MGCWILLKRVLIFDKLVGLRFLGFDKMICGWVSVVVEDGVVIFFEFKEVIGEKCKEVWCMVFINVCVVLMVLDCLF